LIPVLVESLRMIFFSLPAIPQFRGYARFWTTTANKQSYEFRVNETKNLTDKELGIVV
jgi:hypothetical protein